MPKVKHKVTVTVFEDDTVDYTFDGIEGWHIGKMQRQLNRATRALKAEHRKLRQAQLRLQAEEQKERENRAAEEAAAEREATSLGKQVKSAVKSGNSELASLVKEKLNPKTNEEVTSNADDTGANRGDAGKPAEGAGAADKESGKPGNKSSK